MIKFLKIVLLLLSINFSICNAGDIDFRNGNLLIGNFVDVLEDKVMSIEGVKTVTSSSRNSFASIKVEFDLSRETRRFKQEEGRQWP